MLPLAAGADASAITMPIAATSVGERRILPPVRKCFCGQEAGRRIGAPPPLLVHSSRDSALWATVGCRPSVAMIERARRRQAYGWIVRQAGTTPRRGVRSPTDRPLPSMVGMDATRPSRPRKFVRAAARATNDPGEAIEKIKERVASRREQLVR